MTAYLSAAHDARKLAHEWRSMAAEWPRETERYQKHVHDCFARAHFYLSRERIRRVFERGGQCCILAWAPKQNRVQEDR